MPFRGYQVQSNLFWGLSEVLYLFFCAYLVWLPIRNCFLSLLCLVLDNMQNGFCPHLTLPSAEFRKMIQSLKVSIKLSESLITYAAIGLRST